MAKSARVDAKIVAVGVAAAAAIGAAAYIGTRVYKQIKDIDLDNIFDDMNETFFSSLNEEEK
jgi:hypothetical protein